MLMGWLTALVFFGLRHFFFLSIFDEKDDEAFSERLQVAPHIVVALNCKARHDSVASPIIIITIIIIVMNVILIASDLTMLCCW